MAKITNLQNVCPIHIPIRLIAPWRSRRPAAARTYAEQMMAGEVFPPVHVIRQSSNLRGYPYRLADGYHRIQAAKRIGRLTIVAIVIVDER